MSARPGRLVGIHHDVRVDRSNKIWRVELSLENQLDASNLGTETPYWARM